MSRVALVCLSIGCVIMAARLSWVSGRNSVLWILALLFAALWFGRRALWGSRKP